MSVGRGRGRGFAEVRETALRRPGQSFIPTFGALINLIENIKIEEINSNADEIVQAINNSIKTNSLKEVFEDLHNQALEDRDFAEKLAIACSNNKVNSINNSNLRLILLQTLQKDFEEREQIRERSIIHFRNSVVLLGEVNSRLKINGKFLDILANPLLQYLELLLQIAEEEDIAIVHSMIILNSDKLLDVSLNKVEDLLIQIRGVLIYRNLSAKSRGVLLFILDYFQDSFKFNDKTKAFYKEHIDNLDQYLNLDVNNKDNISSKSPKSKAGQSSADNNVGNVPKTSKQGKASGIGAHENSPPSATNERPTVPRAIRGAGAVDSAKDKNSKKTPRGKKDKLTDEQIWSSKQNTSSKVWGHDDRFEKDY